MKVSIVLTEHDMNAYTAPSRHQGFALMELPVVITILIFVFLGGFGLGRVYEKRKCEKEKAAQTQK